MENSYAVLTYKFKIITFICTYWNHVCLLNCISIRYQSTFLMNYNLYMLSITSIIKSIFHHILIEKIERPISFPVKYELFIVFHIKICNSSFVLICQNEYENTTSHLNKLYILSTSYSQKKYCLGSYYPKIVLLPELIF